MPAPTLTAVFHDADTAPAEYRIDPPSEQCEYLCDGELRHWPGPRQDVISPLGRALADGTVEPRRIGSYPLLSEAEAMDTLQAACRAYDHGRGAWPTMSVEQRIGHVQAFVVLMQAQRSEVVRRLMWEIGKTLPDAEKEFDRTVEYIADTVEALKELDRAASRLVIEEGVVAQIRRAPMGVVLCMGPYNYPLNETFTTLIPALIMGNTVILKPPKLGVLLHQPLLQAFRDAFPPGVVNTVYGEGGEVIGPLMRSGRIDVLAFIGSSRVADLLRRQHPRPHRLRCVLGLEAKNAAIVLPDADIALAVQECVLGALSFNGQRCTALKILFVHESIADAFVDKLAAAVAALPAGLPWEPGVRITPLPEPGKPEQLAQMLADALERGAQVVNEGGGAVHHSFMAPAVVDHVGPGMRLYTEEQFGPIVPVVRFDDIAQPLQYVVESDYGQQISLFGEDPDTIAALIDPLVNQVCRVNLNSQCQRGPDRFPFTGRKDSAEGTLSVHDALRVFSIRTLVAAKTSAGNQRLMRTILRQRKSRFLATDFIL